MWINDCLDLINMDLSLSSVTSLLLNNWLNVPQIVYWSPYIILLLLLVFWIHVNCSSIIRIHSPGSSCLLNFVCCFLVWPLHFDKHPPAIHIPLFILFPLLQIASATIITSLKYFLFVLADNAVFVVFIHAFEVPIVLGRLSLSPTQLSHSVILILPNSDGFGGVVCAHYLVVPLFKVCILNNRKEV